MGVVLTTLHLRKHKKRSKATKYCNDKLKYLITGVQEGLLADN